MGSVGPYTAPQATIMSKSQTITCRGVVVWGEGLSPQVEQIEVEGPKNGEVRIKMLFASLCHTDVLCSRGFPSAMFPRVLGHEGVGMVESVGEGVKGLKEGDVVIPTYLGECRECENCVSGQTNMCYTHPLQAFTGLMSDSTSRMQAKKRPLYHFLSCSTWCEYTVVDANYLVKIDPRIPLHHASFLSCGFSTGFGAAWKEAPILRKGSSVAVFGLGAVGLGAVEGARVQGATRIIGVDINDIKSEKAKGFGLTDFINPNNHPGKSVADIIKELTGGMGVDFSFECTGVPALVNPAIDCTKVGIGKMVMLGAGTYKTLEMDFIPLLSGRTFRYAVFGGVKVQSDLPTIINKCINKEIKDLDQLLSYEVELEDINKGFKLLKEPDCIKVLIKF